MMKSSFRTVLAAGLILAFTERIACIKFQELGPFYANIRINAIHNIYNICKYNY